jgi:hypothetical protein
MVDIFYKTLTNGKEKPILIVVIVHFSSSFSVKQWEKIYYRETLNRFSKRVSQAIDSMCKRLLKTKKNHNLDEMKNTPSASVPRFTITSSVIVFVVVLDAAERQYRFPFVVMTSGIVSLEKHVARSTPCCRSQSNDLEEQICNP